MNLVIGKNEGKILEAFSGGTLKAYDIMVRSSLSRSAIGSALPTMHNKGWVQREELAEGNDYSITPLGEKALDAWRVYFGK